MRDDADISDLRAHGVFVTVMTVVGIWAAMRHGGQWAYEIGKWVGAN